MQTIKYFLLFLTLTALILSCGSNLNQNNKPIKEEPVVIANDTLEYEIIIIDPGFNIFLSTIAEPVGYYTQEYLESRNRVWVTEWNQRFRTPQRFDPTLYENEIQYNFNIDYGYDVNYKLFNYFLFAQRKYKMNLGGGFRGDRLN